MGSFGYMAGDWCGEWTTKGLLMLHDLFQGPKCSCRWSHFVTPTAGSIVFSRIRQCAYLGDRGSKWPTKLKSRYPSAYKECEL